MTALDEASLHVHLHTIGVHTLLCVLFALLTAGSNACAAVLQRKAAAQVPPERSMHISLITDLVRRRIWLAGIGMVIVAAVSQAAALATGPIALVQPIFIIELPVTLVLAALANHNRAALGGCRGPPSRSRRSPSAPGSRSPSQAAPPTPPRTPAGSSRSSSPRSSSSR